MEKRKLSVKRSEDDICGCNACYAQNYDSKSSTNRKVDDIYEVRIGSMVNTLCKDCLQELRSQIDQILL